MPQNQTKIKYFLYARKSSEAEDRQVASIDAQIDELKKLAKDNSLPVLEILSEAQSAKAPGRPVFSSMLERIQRGEAGGIICWKLDRLARNPIDGGSISWLLQQSAIQHIQTYGRAYYPTDNVLMMSVELGMANQFIRDLSVNVKRGLRKKLQDGQPIGVAPEGYVNAENREKASRVAVRDPERFVLVRKMWDLMLTGFHNPTEILDTANNEWGYRTIKRRKMGGRPLARSTIYRIFNNPFYYGMRESPVGSGQWYKGNWEPMVTKAEFDRVQILLGSKGIRPSPHTKEFAFTGMIRCGECGGFVTAEEKHRINCSVCKEKFSYINRKACPSCQTPIEQMQNPTIMDYVYYHCSHRINPKCTQGCIQLKDLEEQIKKFLEKIEINQKYLDWALKHLQESRQEECKASLDIQVSQQKALNDITAKLDKLMDMRLREVVSEAEYLAKKAALLKEKEHYQALLQDSDKNQNTGLLRAEALFNFAKTTKEKFENGTLRQKREILQSLGSELTLNHKILSISAHEPFVILQKALTQISEATVRFGTTEEPINKRRTPSFEVIRPLWLNAADAIRTWFVENGWIFIAHPKSEEIVPSIVV